MSGWLPPRVKALRGTCGEVEPLPDVLLGRRCRRCNAVSQLERLPGDRYTECHGCGLLYTAEELQRWLSEDGESGGA